MQTKKKRDGQRKSKTKMTQSTKQKGTMESTNTHRSELDIKSGMPAKSDFGPTTTHDLSETRIAMPFHIFALVANGSNEDNHILTIL